VRWSGLGSIKHPDLRAAGEATMPAIMPVAGTRLAFPELAAEGLEPHDVRELYLSGTATPDRWVEITGFVETKLAALRAHKSQLRDWDPTESVTTRAKENAATARRSGHEMEYAEAFKYFKLAD
jgi:LmbE family N-acetylglucosaminyl deacetylase